MNPINFTLGAIRLPGLFSTCLDIIEKIDDYKHFKADERALAIQFASHRLRFKKWGKSLGLDQEAAELCKERHEALADSETLQTVHQIINIAQEILSDQQGKPAQNPDILPDAKTDLPSSGNLVELPRTAPGSRRARFMWALKEKGRREDQVELLGNLVQHLYHLAPLEAFPQSTVDLAIQNDLQQIVDNASWASEMRPTLKRLEAEAEAESRRELHAWLLDSRSVDLRGMAISSRRSSETQAPMDQRTGRLWKTILCAKISEHLSTTVKSPVAHFFFSSDFESCNDPYEAVRCWISNVMFQNNTIFDHIRAEREKHLESVATRALVMQLFQKVVHLLPGCVFIMDGLDECTWLNRGITGLDDSITSFLEKLGHAVAESATRIMIVSRDEPAIRAGMESMESIQVSEYKILLDDVNNDTNKYSRSIVEKKLSQKNEVLKEEISQKMAERCAGQFLWLKLQGDLLRGGKNSKQLQAVIKNTPSGLESLYKRNWDRLSGLPEDDRNRAFTLLRLATFAAKPLTVAELAEASIISIASEVYPIDDLPDAIDDEYINSEIIGLCGSLLSIYQNATDLRSSTVRLTHFSIKQYYLYHDPNSGNVSIQSEVLRRSNEQKENTTVAQICLQYIQYEETWRTEDSRNSSQVQGSFRNYAADFWYHHFLEGNQEDELMNKLINDLFDSHDSAKWKQWRETYDSIEKSRMKTSVKIGNDEDEKRKKDRLARSTPPSPVLYASKLNLTKLTMRLIEKHRDHLDDMSYFGETALSVACVKGNEEIARELIMFGANLNLASWSGNSPLHLAVIHCHLNLVQLLLESGAEVNALDYGKSTPLHSASFAGANDIARTLLAYGANTTALDSLGYHPLHRAIVRKNIDMARLLIAENPGQLKTYSSCKPTFMAIMLNNVELMQVLLEYGANINLVDRGGDTGLAIAVLKGLNSMARFLIEKGADPNIRNSNGRTAVVLATINENHEALRILIENGANLTIFDNDGFGALHFAAYVGSVDSLRILLINGADQGLMSGSESTPLLFASEGGHTDVVRLLLENGANPIVETAEGETPLSAAIRGGHVEIVDLIESGAGILATNNLGYTPLYYAAMKGHSESIQFLLEKGADLAPLDTFENSLLHVASLYGQAEVIKDQLQKYGPTTINKTELDGRTPLFDAAMRGESEVIGLLLSHSADVNVRDRYNASALFAAVRYQQLEVIQQLLAVDHIALEYEDCFGQTAFSWAYRSKNRKIIELMELAAARRNFEIPSHIELQTSLEDYVFHSEAAFCDICTRTIQFEMEYFGCKECIGFVICSECATTGVRCRENFHEWLSQSDVSDTHAHYDKE